MLNKTRKWSEPNDCDGSTCTSCMKDVLESTISKIFPLICVGLVLRARPLEKHQVSDAQD